MYELKTYVFWLFWVVVYWMVMVTLRNEDSNSPWALYIGPIAMVR